MKFETLKRLSQSIRVSPLGNTEEELQLQEKTEKGMIEQFLELLELYENDNQEHTQPQPSIEKYPSPFDKFSCPNVNNDLVPYHTICGCNPQNGGNGICGCVMGNTMVPMVQKTNWETNLSFPNINLNNNNETTS